MKEDSQRLQTVPVLVPMPAERPYSYAVPAGMSVRPGSIVRVPLGPREVAGIVWDTPTDGVDPKKLRPISQLFDCPPLDEAARRFVDWVAAWTLSAPGMVARMFLRAPAAFDPEMPLEGLRWTGGEPQRMTDARARVLELVHDRMAWTRSGLAHAAGVSSTVVDGLREQFASTIAPRLLLPETAWATATLLSAIEVREEMTVSQLAAKRSRLSRKAVASSRWRS